ncbi:hypothetical protein T4B_3200 [Trichinella pseudospiralis]|uniref:Uncharacterized protein n=1 Tax=Trichinella pseudospiralis TaxID=6337 RepID=A0A0V1J9K2_TRIPS|nr:hypothetical protein T4B_3200 [Trichinella pseudospiralis]
MRLTWSTCQRDSVLKNFPALMSLFVIAADEDLKILQVDVKAAEILELPGWRFSAIEAFTAISQSNYIEEILEKLNMQSCKSVASPGDLSIVAPSGARFIRDI